jgi:PAS domain S-box-containing protein
MLSKVLIVDDDTQNLKLLEKILKNKGYQVILSHNGSEALAAAQQTLPNLVVSDILMPVMDGFTLCQKWNRDPRFKNIPFIFYTATYTDSRDEQLAMSLGAVRFIVKPADPDIFLKTIQAVLDEFSQGTANVHTPKSQKEEVILAEYNEALVRKLEQKIQEMKEINLALEKEISKRESAETALHQSEEKLRRVFEALHGGIIITDIEGNIVDCNTNTVNMVQMISKDEIIGKKIIEFLPLDEQNKTLMNFQNVVETGYSRNNKYTAVKHDGTLFPIEASSCVVKDQFAKPLFVVISFMDITERKQMEDRIIELYEQEKKQREELQEEANARGLFIEVLGHELRTPLTPILACSGMLNDKLQSLPEDIQRKLCSNINSGAQTLSSRLEELLDLASYSRGTFKLQLKPTNIHQLVEEVISGFQPTLAAKSQKAIFVSSNNFPQIEIDPSRLKLVLINLLSNANKFSSENGRILINARLKDSKLFMEVQDKGCGLSEEEQERLFQPYHRVEQDRQKFPGIGLGLAICRQIIEAHQGEIWVSSQLGQGSTFSFYIPLNQA